MKSHNIGAMRKSAVRFPPGAAFISVLFCAAGLLAAPLAAQETTGAYFVRESETGEQTIVQRLFWPGDENASRYEVAVEREDAGVFAEIHRESTDNDYIDISLGPGKYRYHVRVFNLLNQFEYVTNWASFSIILALQPEIAAYAPNVLYIYEDHRWELRLEGTNLVEDGEAYLVPLEGPAAPAQFITPEKYVPSGKGALLAFNNANLRPGVYRVLVRNPGGLEASAGPVNIDAFRPPSIELSAGYAPLLPLYGYLFDTFDKFALLGMDLRGAFVFFKQPWGFLGVEANFNLNYLKTNSDNADISAFITGSTVSLLYKKLLPLRSFVFNARLGGGISVAPLRLVFDYGNYTSDPLTSWVPQAALGVSLEWKFTAFFYAELGADYVHLFSRDSPQPGFLLPFFNVGWKFFLRNGG
jgi:hypothetical protein